MPNAYVAGYGSGRRQWRMAAADDNGQWRRRWVMVDGGWQTMDSDDGGRQGRLMTTVGGGWWRGRRTTWNTQKIDCAELTVWRVDRYPSMWTG